MTPVIRLGNDRVFRSMFRSEVGRVLPGPSGATADGLRVLVSMYQRLVSLALPAMLSACLAEDVSLTDDDAGDTSANLELASSVPPWGPPTVIASPMKARGPRIAVDPTGKATAVWLVGSTLFAAQSAPDSNTWTEPVAIEDLSDDISEYRIAADATGAVIVVWKQGALACGVRFTPAAGWGSPRLISWTADGFSLELAMNATGVAIAAWGSPRGTHAARFTPVSGGEGAWGAEAQIADGGRPSVAIDDGGNAFVASRYAREMWVTRGTASGWHAPELVYDGTPGTTPNDAIVLAEGGGKATVVYSRGGMRLEARRFTPTGGWSAAEIITAPHPMGIDHDIVAANRGGEIVVGWTRGVVTGGSWVSNRSLWTVRHTPGTGWSGDRELLPSSDGSTVRVVDGAVAIDAAGNGHLLWHHVTASGLGTVRATGFVGTGTWRGPQTISTSGIAAGPPSLGVTADGRAMAVWREGPAVGAHIMGARFE